MYRQALPIFAIYAALLGAACGFDPADIDADRPVLFAIEGGTTPRDSTESLHEPDGLPLIVSFNREFEPGEVSHVEIVPRPMAMGEVLAPAANPRQLLIPDVVLDPRHQVYRLVVDGPSMPSPMLLSYYSDVYRAGSGAIEGHLEYPRVGREAEDVLVYGLVPPGREYEFELTGSEDTLFGQPVVCVTISRIVPTHEGGWFRLTGMRSGSRHAVFAIIDSSGDGEYDLTNDWWGYFRDEGDDPVEVVALGGFATFLRADFSLLAPGSLPSLWGE